MVKASEIPDILSTHPDFIKMDKDNVSAWVYMKKRTIRCYYGGVHGFIYFNQSVSYFTNENTYSAYPYRLAIPIF